MKKSEKLTSYEQVCKKDGVDPIASLPFPNPETSEQKAINAVAKTWRIVRIFNNNVKVDFDNPNQERYSVWWNMRSEAAGGAGFSYFVCTCDDSTSDVGARLTFLDYDAVVWVTSQPEFVNIFKEWMTVQE